MTKGYYTLAPEEAQAIKGVIEEKRLRQGGLAPYLGVRRETLNKYLNRARMPVSAGLGIYYCLGQDPRLDFLLTDVDDDAQLESYSSRLKSIFSRLNPVKKQQMLRKVDALLKKYDSK
ncbi:MAG: hypothetical protein HYT70_01735 [Candidatus Aenigmarchaeota archaeon]|nr:hypothetical protein [Candidatus Aenigmarchaeota archaeon]